MKQSITKCQFSDAFRDHDRQDQFTYDGLNALYDYLERYEEDTGCDVELDVIALCCEYTEYEDLEEFQKNYDAEDYETVEDIEKETCVILIGNGSFIIQDF